MINIRLKRAILATALCGASMGVIAQDGVDLGKITVKGEGMREADRSFTVNTVGQDRISAERWEYPLTILEEVPGFDAVAYQHGGVADVFTIRGFTGGGHGSDAGMALDGISLNEGESHADGYGDTNIIIPLEIDHVQVFKGPVSPLYGNFARSGVVAFHTRKTGEYADFNLSMGSFDTYDAQAAFGTNIDGLQINGALQGYESEGWRRHSRYTKMNAALRGAYTFGDSEIALSLRGHGGEWDAPNYIQHDQFSDKSRRREENPFTRMQEDEGSKRLNSQRLDFFHNLSDDLKLLAFAYRTRSDFTRYQSSLRVLDSYPDLNALPADFMDPNAPVNITQIAPQTEHVHRRDAMAFGASLNGTSTLLGSNSNWVVGIEYYDEEADVERWDDVRRARYNLRQDDRFNIKTTSLYGQLDMDINPRFRPTLGFRYDNFDGDRDNRLTGTKTDMNSYDHFAPKLGLRSALTDTWELRASVANGFGLPSSEAKYDPSVDVDNLEIWQYEIGINGAPTPQWYLDLAAFLIDTSDEIMRDPNDGNRFVNAGKTRRTGLEGEVRFFPSAVENLEIFTAFALYDSEVKRNVDNAVIGKEVVRVPDYIANVGVRYAPPVGWGGQIRLRSLGSWYTNATNTIKYDGYDVVNASLFYSFRTDGSRKARVFLDINNIFDEVYSENVSGGPHPAQGDVPTSYSPRPPANAMVGFMMSL
jgi:iron complex outermembrane receptor protein